MEEEIALMYSGGVDTTYIALNLLHLYKRVHLLTFCNGLCIRVNSSKKHAQMLIDKYGKDKVIHRIFPIGEIFRFIRKDLYREMLRYKTPLLFDLSCRFSMEIATIIYCLRYNLKYVTDGNNPNTQGEIFLQQQAYLDMVRNFFSRYGIKYIHPVKLFPSRRKIVEELQKNGIKSRLGFLENFHISAQLLTQPFCLWAPIAFLFTSPLRRIPIIKYFSLSIQNAFSYRKEKEKIAEALIDKYLQSRDDFFTQLHLSSKNYLYNEQNL